MVPAVAKCPVCGSRMVTRVAKKGPKAGQAFRVCIHYPDCRGRVPIGIEETRNEDEIKWKAGEEILRIAYLRGHIPHDVYLDHNALRRWWHGLNEQRRKRIVEDCIGYIKATDGREKRAEWHRNKFRTPGWRAWLAGAVPALFAIRWLVYAPGAQKWWGVAIFIGGAILMRLLIGLYDVLRGNPRRVPSGAEAERGAKTSSHTVDIVFLAIGAGLLIGGAVLSSLVMLIVGVVFASMSLLFFFLRRKYVKRGYFPKHW